MPELFIEILSEEVPARMQTRALDDLVRLLTAKLTEAGLGGGTPTGRVTPRRLAVAFPDVALAQADRREERRGPRVGAPEAALAGFLKSTGLARIDDAERRTLPNGDFWFAVMNKPGQAARAVLPDLIVATMRDLPWPKSMRWGHGTVAWVRPLTSLIALFDGAVLDGGVDVGDGTSIPFGNSTVGHRFLAPDRFAVRGFTDYVAKLGTASVVVDPAERARLVRAGAERLAAAEGLRVRNDPGLVDEIVGLVEWPVPLVGRIDDGFMDLPSEVLTTSMRAHQRYVALETADGALASRFVVVANMTTPDQGRTIVAGNERVLRARLSDARFFWDQDRRTHLHVFAEKLDQRVFHARLGTVAERAVRLTALARHLAPLVGADPDMAARAAALCKADLSSGMVGEFPELQGVMGGYYARQQGEATEVADAIARHYSPLGPGDRVPTAPVAVAVALADKIDALAGFFGIDEKPTGSRDPFALRRAGLGILRILGENRLRVNLRPVFAVAAGSYAASTAGAVADDLIAFLADRLKVHLRERGLRHDLIQAVLQAGFEDDFVRLEARVEALRDFLATPTGGDLLAGYRRAANILRIEEKKGGVPVQADPALFTDPAEHELFGALDRRGEEASAHFVADHFADAMSTLGLLRDPVDAFFDRVTVNAESHSLRANRLALLAKTRHVFGHIADFSAIEG